MIIINELDKFYPYNLIKCWSINFLLCFMSLFRAMSCSNCLSKSCMYGWWSGRTWLGPLIHHHSWHQDTESDCLLWLISGIEFHCLHTPGHTHCKASNILILRHSYKGSTSKTRNAPKNVVMSVACEMQISGQLVCLQLCREYDAAELHFTNVQTSAAV